ncbi:hypothetical protein Hanom_Chr03g00226561 [Helianthus anomalus]
MTWNVYLLPTGYCDYPTESANAQSTLQHREPKSAGFERQDVQVQKRNLDKFLEQRETRNILLPIHDRSYNPFVTPLRHAFLPQLLRTRFF